MNWSPRPRRWFAPLALIASVVFTNSLNAQY